LARDLVLEVRLRMRRARLMSEEQSCSTAQKEACDSPSKLAVGSSAFARVESEKKTNKARVMRFTISLR
jgi:hypothetical protein